MSDIFKQKQIITACEFSRVISFFLLFFLYLISLQEPTPKKWKVSRQDSAMQVTVQNPTQMSKLANKERKIKSAETCLVSDDVHKHVNSLKRSSNDIVSFSNLVFKVFHTALT